MRKTLSLSLLCSLISFKAFSQDYVKTIYTPETSKTYLGFGSGINNYVGMLGPTIEQQIAQKFTIAGGLGLGSWGYKLSGGIRFYANYPSRWAFGLGFSQATGVEKIDMEMPAGYVVGYSSNVTVPVKLKAANTVNLSALRYWMIGQRKVNRFNIELGYAIPVAENQYEIITGEQLTAEGKFFMNYLQPGGLILGAGFSFGL